MAYKSLPASYSVLWNRIKIIILLLLCGIVLISAIQMLHTYSKSRRATREVVVIQEGLRQKQEQLKTDISLFESDFGKEALLRERYGYIKEGEHAIFITNTRQAISVDRETNSSETLQNKSLWVKIKTFFSHSQ